MKIASNTAKLLRNVPLPDEISTIHDTAAVVDMGTGTTRLGFAGDYTPRITAPTVIATSQQDSTTEYLNKAFKSRETMEINNNIMEKGLIKDWKAVESMWGHLDSLLGMSKSTDTPLLLSEAALAPREQRDQLTQILFETINIPSLYFSTSPVLGLYSSGRSSGLVIEMGHGTSHCVPIYQGFSIFHSIMQMDFGGDDITKWLGGIITEGGTVFPSCHEKVIWEYIKEVNCCLFESSEEYNRYINNNNNNKGSLKSHVLPDGTVLHLGAERYTACESIFQPHLINNNNNNINNKSFSSDLNNNNNNINNNNGLHHLAAAAIRKCDGDLTGLLCNNIVLTGGHSLFKGISNRLSRGITDIITDEKVRVSQATESRDAVFIGGSILASLPTFQDMWVTRADYNEYGSPQVTSRNCF